MIVNIILIISTVLVSLLAFSDNRWLDKLQFNAYDIHHRNQWYRVLTYGWVHADWVHLLVNMFVLYSFGTFVADAYRVVDTKNGLFYYILLYLGGLAFSILSDLAKHKNNPYYRAVGASGAVSAVVFASILLNPLAKIYLFFIPIGIPAFIFGIIYLIYSAYMARNSHGHIGHAAHFWGAVYGVVFTVIFEPRLVLGFATKVTDFF